jgi:hypothetical protein
MLPDFATMCGARLAEIDHPELRAGIALHHRTDRVFHASSHFLALCGDARRDLLARGLGRGHAQAVGHVGVELLLDGWLVEQPKARETYAAACAAEDTGSWASRSVGSKRTDASAGGDSIGVSKPTAHRGTTGIRRWWQPGSSASSAIDRAWPWMRVGQGSPPATCPSCSKRSTHAAPP